MFSNPRPAPFILASTNFGTMIVNRLDEHGSNAKKFGVGYNLLTYSSFDIEEIKIMLNIIDLIRNINGDGVCVVDCGANIGCHTLSFAKHMHGWGSVIGFEAQPKIFYALAGNVIINNCLNAEVFNYAVGENCGTIFIPQPDYNIASSFGSLEIKQSLNSEFIGQEISSNSIQKEIPLVSIDSLNFSRLDFLKIDVEGMDFEVLKGAKETIKKFKPIIFVEYVKCNPNEIIKFLSDFGYELYTLNISFLAISKESSIYPYVSFDNQETHTKA